jgi:hypothetical protein
MTLPHRTQAPASRRACPPVPARVSLWGALWGALFATVEITALALVAHVVAGGALPGTTHVLGLATVVFVVASAYAGRRVRLPVVVALVFAAQLALHVVADPGPMAGQHPMRGMPGMIGPTVPAPDMTAPMLLAHVVGALVTAIVLLLQERVLDVAIERLSPELSRPALPGRDVALARTLHDVVGRNALLALSPRRGPPAVVATP